MNPTKTHTDSTIWISWHPPQSSGLPSIATFAVGECADADPESAGLLLCDRLSDEQTAAMTQSYLLPSPTEGLPDVVLVYAHDDALTGAVLGAAWRAQSVTYLVGDGAQALADKLAREGLNVQIAATSAEAAEAAIAAHLTGRAS